MHSSIRWYCLRVLVPGLLAMLPAVTQAGGAFLVKGGNMYLTDDRQTLNSAQRDLDETSFSTLAFNLEGRKRNGVAFGVEYLTYRHEFTPPAAQPGEAKTQTVQFIGKKYFVQDGPVHPYIGIGIGAGRTNVTYTDIGVSFSDEEFTLAMQVLLGIELRFDNLSFLAEVKHLYHDIEGGGNEYDPTATGLFLGMGFNW